MQPHDDRAFFDAFDAALAGNAEALAPWLKSPAPGLAVYRNTIASGAIDALAATFATIQLMTGDDWFRAELATPLGAAVIDHTGRLERLP